MKVKVEFQEAARDQDPESAFDAVELTTSYAGDIDDWAGAILDIARLAPWPRRLILLSALVQDSTDVSPRGSWVKENIGGLSSLADELSKLVDQACNKPTQENKSSFDWSIGDRLARLQEYINDPTIRSLDQHRQEKERIAKELGCKNVKVVTNKVSKIRKGSQ